MSIDVFSANQFTWWKEHCLLCGSANHIFIDTLSVDAWECWSCKSRWWIDNLSEGAYMAVHGKSQEEANYDLLNANQPLIILSGQAQRW